MPVIKRYSNRKLYDSEKRTYVTLEAIGNMIRMGDDVEVIDHESGQDITASTLAQIIYDQEKRIGGMLPNHLLTRLIRTAGSRKQFFRDNFLAFFDPLQYADNEIRRRLDWLTEAGKMTSEEKSKLLDLVLSPELLAASEHDLALESQPLEEEISKEEIEHLLDQIESLEQELESLGGSQITP